MPNKTNFIVSVVRILEIPKKVSLKNNVSLIKFRAELPTIRNRSIVNLFFWGNLGNEIDKYYKPEDYILVEGYLSLSNSKSLKKSQITVLKVYPFILKSNTGLREF